MILFSRRFEGIVFLNSIAYFYSVVCLLIGVVQDDDATLSQVIEAENIYCIYYIYCSCEGNFHINDKSSISAHYNINKPLPLSPLKLYLCC